MSKRLIKQVDCSYGEDFSDNLYVFISAIEDALLTAGAEPGKDYNYTDLLVSAVPFLKNSWKTGKITVSIPKSR